MQSFPSTFPSPEIRSLKSTPYSTGRVANRLGAGVRREVGEGVKVSKSEVKVQENTFLSRYLRKQSDNLKG